LSGAFCFTEKIMAKNILTAASFTIADSARAIFIQVNAALTGNIIVADGGGTIATITNPTVGSTFQYGGLKGAVTVTPSTTCDITVTVTNQLA
jgi:hypothetical protein